MEINGSRLQKDLTALADLARTEGGINRLTYSDAFWRSCDFVEQKMREAGMTVRRNALGNVVGTLPGKGPRKIVMGSHIDSVPNGGMFDGCLGVMAAIEAVHTLREQGLQLEHSVDVAAWAEEEGVVISGLMGSLAYCGLPLRPVQLEKMGQYGVTEADVAACRAEGPLDYSLELHIEQGGILDAEGDDIGVVSAIIAQKRYQMEIDGCANHAGTTPMYLRDDALVKAAKLIVRCSEIAPQVDPNMVITVGHIEVTPNAMNVVPGRVRFTLELRAAEEASIQAAYEQIMEEFGAEIVSTQLIQQERAYRMDPAVMEAISDAAASLGLRSRVMPSGAGHDTMSLAQVTRPGMIFVPSVGGISHSPEERTAWKDVENGANVLLQALLRLDGLGV